MMKLVDDKFKIEDLAMGRMEKKQFQIDYLPLWKMLDEWERKIGGFNKTPMKDIFERIYEYAMVSSGLDRADNATRIDNLNEQNLKWFTRATDLEAQVEQLKIRLQEKQASNENS